MRTLQIPDSDKRKPCGGTPIQPEDPDSATELTALWLQDHVFKGSEYREHIHPNRSEEHNSRLRNIHTLFRKDLDIPDKDIRQARLYITADDTYKLYINGAFTGLGPAPAYPFDYPYNAWDATGILKTGSANCIGVHTFYSGLHSLTFPSADNLAGMLLQLEIDYKDGTSSSLISDDTWKCKSVDAYESRQIYGYQTAFSEDIDLRKLPRGWSESGYNDGDWTAPLASEVPEIYSMKPQQTPPAATFRRAPERIICKGNGHYFIDFGTQLTGETAFRLSGTKGHVVEIRHGEELESPETVRYEMRCNCTYQEFCTLSGKKNELLEFFDYKGFRYVEVLNWPEELLTNQVWANERHYPFPDDASMFKSSSPLLNDIWDLCENGVRTGTVDTYLDCPTREKGGFMGDGFVTGISHLILTGDARILRKFLKDVAGTGRYCPGLHSTAPNYVNGELAEYSLLWPVLLEYYYNWSADLEFLQEMIPTLEGLLRYYAEYENDAGLLQDVYSHSTGRYSVLVDWPKNLRDEYDDPYLMGERKVDTDPKGVVNTMVQGFYVCALNAARRLSEAAASASLKTLVDGRPEKVRSAVLDQLYNRNTGLFVDRNGSDHSSLHANVTGFLAGMVSPERSGAVIDFISKKRLSCGVYFSFFVLKSLYNYRQTDLAYDLITSKDLHSWNSMLEAGATTCMEAWAPDLKWNTSWCHPWSSSPIAMITHELLGLRPLSPGWKTVSFTPHPPEKLTSASVKLTTPNGVVHASYKRHEKEIDYKLRIPEGSEAICQFCNAKEVRLNGHKCESTRQTDKNSCGILKIPQPLSAGSHLLSVR